MVSPTWWPWVWVNSRNWWWIGRPGLLQFLGLQRVRHDWATEQQNARRQGAPALKSPEFPEGFPQSILKSQVMEGSHRVCDQLMHNSWIGWHQHKVSSVINLLVLTSLGSCSRPQQFSSGGGLLPIKTTWNVCRAFICIFQGTGSLVILLHHRFIV